MTFVAQAIMFGPQIIDCCAPIRQLPKKNPYVECNIVNKDDNGTARMLNVIWGREVGCMKGSYGIRLQSRNDMCNSTFRKR